MSEPTCGEFRARCLSLGAQLLAHQFRRQSLGWYRGYIIVSTGTWGKMLKRVNPNVKNPRL